MRKLLIALGLVALAATAAAQNDYRVAMIRYDVDSSTTTYCSTSMVGFPGAATVSTSGSSTTVASAVASSGALKPVLVGDVIVAKNTSTSDLFTAGYAAVVVAKASDDSITVDPAVNWSALSYTYYRAVCGTTVDDGWISMGTYSKATITIAYPQGDLGALSWRFECRSGIGLASVPVVVYPSEGDGCGNDGAQVTGYCDYATAAATATFSFEDFGSWSACRIGFKYSTSDASDAGANLERVTGTITLTKGN